VKKAGPGLEHSSQERLICPSVANLRLGSASSLPCTYGAGTVPARCLTHPARNIPSHPLFEIVYLDSNIGGSRIE